MWRHQAIADGRREAGVIVAGRHQCRLREKVEAGASVIVWPRHRFVHEGVGRTWARGAIVIAEQLDPHPVDAGFAAILEVISRRQVKPDKVAVAGWRGIMALYADAGRFGDQQIVIGANLAGAVGKRVPRDLASKAIVGRTHPHTKCHFVIRAKHEAAKVKLERLHRGKIRRGRGAPISGYTIGRIRVKPQVRLATRIPLGAVVNRRARRPKNRGD